MVSRQNSKAAGKTRMPGPPGSRVCMHLQMLTAHPLGLRRPATSEVTCLRASPYTELWPEGWTEKNQTDTSKQQQAQQLEKSLSFLCQREKAHPPWPFPPIVSLGYLSAGWGPGGPSGSCSFTPDLGEGKGVPSFGLTPSEEQ